MHSKLFQIIAEVTGDLTGNKIADKITKVSKTLRHNTLETVPSETKNTGFDVL